MKAYILYLLTINKPNNMEDFMKIIVVGDTHIPKRAKKIPQVIKRASLEADLMIHVGDWQTLDVYQEFLSLGNVEGVYGNVDDQELKAILPEKRILLVHSFKIGIFHGHGRTSTTEKRAIQAFENDKVDCILFGHSHIPVMKYHEDILLFNPGSATDKRKQKEFSYGILEVGEQLRAKHIFYSNRE